jgi:cytochrome c oxidase subunit 2
MLATAGRPEGPSFWLPAQGSTAAAEVDWLFYFIFWLSVIFFVLIVGLMVLFTFRYLRPKGSKAQKAPHHNLSLELTWSVIPVILVIVIFLMGFKGFISMATPPQNAYEILVSGKKWAWTFEYPETGYIGDELHVPVDRDILLTMTSEDVIHSLFIPAFRIKKDVVPGRYTKMSFRAKDPGTYTIFCAEYCGTKHSDMYSACVVHPPGEFEKWLTEASNFLDRMTPAEAGQELYRRRGCYQCHSIDGTSGIGPSFKTCLGTRRSCRTAARWWRMRTTSANPSSSLRRRSSPGTSR